jgi:hypothetical protein
MNTVVRDLLDFAGANGTMLTIAALNDYSADMTVADARSIDVILAYGYAETLAAAAALAPVTLAPFFAAWAGDFDV